ncbi:uncharacterized protein TNCV_1837621 [Trichonephila clavipes]|nr:uncharacterized protein TNCV_1837621 [Trichonephila clavipes]
MKKVKEALNLHITAVHFWSDSTIVISWIHRESRELKTIVANRVSKIHQLSSRDQWHHIASEQNLADVLTRGLLPEEPRDDSLWWHMVLNFFYRVLIQPLSFQNEPREMTLTVN